MQKIHEENTTLKKVNIIFLDFDGVLKDSTPGQHVTREHIERLNFLIDSTDAHIVFSTNWRLGMSLAKLHNYLLHNGLRPKQNIAGVTPILFDYTQNRSGVPHAVERQYEIKAWLDTAKHVKNFVILEDFEKMDIFPDNAVMTNPKIGMTDEDVEKAIRILNNGL